MRREFWLERWHNNDIGWHQSEVNRRLAQYWGELAVPEDGPVFVPLCGKSLDMRWLSQQGHAVVGVELSEAAIRAYFDEANEIWRTEQHQFFVAYIGPSARIYCGDFMDLSAYELKGVCGVFDRGALVALPPRMRSHYADHLQRILPERSRILLVTLEYDQTLVNGPPHAVLGEEVEALFGDRCEVIRLGSHITDQLPPKFAKAGATQAAETVYAITKRK
jgi:thiopurine S-methyltransferase